MNQIYLDHAATTPPLPEVCDTMISYMKSEWGNPSSLYDFSDEPRRAVLDARAHTAALIHADPKRIFFTSGGSESDSWALIGCARQPGRIRERESTLSVPGSSMHPFISHWHFWSP